MSNWLKNLLLLLISSLVSLALLEGALQLLSLIPAANSNSEAGGESLSLGHVITPHTNKDIVYTLKQNFSGTFQHRALNTNSWGYRDNEWERTKPAGRIRIAALGDSVMFGWGVKEEERYTSLLEKMLNEKLSGQVEVQNFAVPGYNTTMEVATFADVGKKFTPDAVILNFINNDFEVPFFMSQPPRFNFKIASLISQAWAGASQENERELVGFDFPGVTAQRKRQVLQQYQHMVGTSGFRNAMARLATLTDGIPVYILYATATSAQRKELKRAAEKYGFKLVNLKPFVEEFAKKHNLSDDKTERRRIFWVTETDPHPSPLAHTIYAQALFDTLTKDPNFTFNSRSATLPPSSH